MVGAGVFGESTAAAPPSRFLSHKSQVPFLSDATRPNHHLSIPTLSCPPVLLFSVYESSLCSLTLGHYFWSQRAQTPPIVHAVYKFRRFHSTNLSNLFCCCLELRLGFKLRFASLKQHEYLNKHILSPLPSK